MQFVFDHLVHFVEEPNEAKSYFNNKGIYTVDGGAHINYGTYNTLTYFDLSYIEFLGVHDRQKVIQYNHLKHSLMETIVQNNFREGFARFAVRTNDIERTATYFQNQGLTVTGPTPLRRKRPDGSILSWQLLHVGDDLDQLQLPFIIQWDDTDETRRLDLIEKNVITSHKAGKLTLSHLTLVVQDLARVDQWASFLQLEKGEMFADETLQATCQRLKLKGGDLIFVKPNEEGILASALEEKGEHIYQVTFGNGERDETFQWSGGTYSIAK